MKPFKILTALALFAGISPQSFSSAIECRWTCQKQDEYGVCIEWISVCDDHKGIEPSRFALSRPELPELLSKVPANTLSFSTTHGSAGVEISDLTAND